MHIFVANSKNASFSILSVFLSLFSFLLKLFLNVTSRVIFGSFWNIGQIVEQRTNMNFLKKNINVSFFLRIGTKFLFVRLPLNTTEHMKRMSLNQVIRYGFFSLKLHHIRVVCDGCNAWSSEIEILFVDTDDVNEVS